MFIFINFYNKCKSFKDAFFFDLAKTSKPKISKNTFFNLEWKILGQIKWNFKSICLLPISTPQNKIFLQMGKIGAGRIQSWSFEITLYLSHIKFFCMFICILAPFPQLILKNVRKLPRIGWFMSVWIHSSETGKNALVLLLIYKMHWYFVIRCQLSFPNFCDHFFLQMGKIGAKRIHNSKPAQILPIHSNVEFYLKKWIPKWLNYFILYLFIPYNAKWADSEPLNPNFSNFCIIFLNS